MLVNHHNLGILFTGLKANFSRGFELAKPKWQQVAMEIPSATEKEQYDWLGVAPGMREWVDERLIQSLGTHQYQIPNKDWEQTVGVLRNKILDDTHGVYSPISLRMGDAAALHPDELIYGDLMNNGAAAANTSYDGVPFFSAVHPIEDTGTQSNYVAAGGGPAWYLADLSSPLKPFILQMRQKPNFVSRNALTDDEVFHRKRFLMGVDARYNAGYGMWQYVYRSHGALNEANFETAWETMSQIVADNGKPMNIMPTHLVVPVTLFNDARRVVTAKLVGGGDSNIHENAVDILLSKHLSNT